MKSAAPTLKDAIEYLKAHQKGMIYDNRDPLSRITWSERSIKLVGIAIKALEAPPAAERTAQRDAALEIRTRIIDILDECDRTVYAQQKWKVARAGLQGWLFKVEAENPEIIKEVADASEGTKSE